MGRLNGRIALALGGVALVVLLAWLGARQIGVELWRAAWTVPLCVGLHAVQLGLSALAWRGLAGAAGPSRLGWWRIRWVREAVNSMLPVGQVGGNLVGVRLLAAGGAGQATAAAATVLDLTAEAATQAAFTIAGIAVLAALAPDRRWLPWVGGGTLALCLGIVGFVAAQRAGLLRLLEAAGGRLRRFLPGLDLSGLAARFATLRRERAALTQAAALHGLAWLLGTGETALALTALHAWPGWAAALAIESLGMAARSAGFAIPAALGVQEAGYVLVCGLFAIPPETAVALSMVKRARELAVGTAGLVAWQGSEGLFRRRLQPGTPAPRSVGSPQQETPP